MKKILVLGAGGMAGHVISLFLREHNFCVDTLSAKTKLDENTKLLDVRRFNELNMMLDIGEYDAVINCIGILVKECESSKDKAVCINSYLPRHLESYLRNSKTRIIHLSTDAVFSGINGPYKEDSDCDGKSFYGRTKALGEINNTKDLTFRMSIIGPELDKSGLSLFNWFNDQKGEIFGFTNIEWSGITTIELAKSIKSAIEENLTGIYHLVPSVSITKYELLSLFKGEFNRTDIRIKPIEGSGINSKLLNTRSNYIFNTPSYKEMVAEMKKWMDIHKEIYGHYAK